MAWTPAFYFQPTAEDGTTGSYQTVAFPTGVGVSAAEDAPVRARRGVVPTLGLPRLVNYGVSRVVTVEVTGLLYGSHAAFLRKLMSMDSALTLGAVCHFTMDHARRGAWCLRNVTDTAYAVPSLGGSTVYFDLTLGVVQDLFTTDPPGGGSLTDTDTSGDGDNLVRIETLGPESHAHVTTVSSISGAVVTLTEAWPHSSSMGKAYMCWPYFYGALTLTDEALAAPRLTRSGRTWRYQASFVQSPQRIFDLFP